MFDVRRTLAGIAVAAVASTGMAGAVLVEASPAAATTSVVTSHSAYPPGKCTASTSRATYEPGHKVHFTTRKHCFGSREVANITVTGPHHYAKNLVRRAGTGGRVKGTFKLGKHLRAGKYTITLIGKRHNKHVLGQFQVS